MAFLLGWEIGFFFDARGFFFARQRGKKKLVFFWCFFWCFWCFLGVFVCFSVFFFVFRALAGGKLVFFRRWHEQNREFPLWVQPDSK